MESIYFVFKGQGNHALYSASYGVRADQAAAEARVWQGNEALSRQLGKLFSRVNSQSAMESVTCWHAEQKKLYLVYRHADTNELTIGHYDGHAWYGGSTLLLPGGVGPRKTDRRPAMAVFLHQLYLVYKQAGNSTILLTFMTPDGRWTPTQTIHLPNGAPLTTDADVELVTFGNELWLLYKESQSNTLRACVYRGGNYWAEDHPIQVQGQGSPAMSRRGPTAAVFNNKLHVCYQDQNSNNLYLSVYDRNTRWSGNTPITCRHSSGQTSIPASTAAPGMVAFEQKLHLVYRSQSDTLLFTAVFDGHAWTGNTPISTQPGGISPRSDFNPSLSVTPFPVLTFGNWLQHLPDNRCIGEINLLGTHDTAAIRTSGKSTPYACHDRTITEQLRDGVRLLDIRIEVEKIRGGFEFWTCHGKMSGGEMHLSRYEPLKQALDTCRDFLRDQPSEFLAILLQIDNWHSADGDRDNARRALQTFLAVYPFYKWTSKMPTKKDVKGRFVPFSRLEIAALGPDFPWPNNTEWYAQDKSSSRDFPWFVQDYYGLSSKTNPQEWKYSLYRKAINNVKDGSGPFLLLNFASGTTAMIFGVYIQRDVVAAFGGQPGGIKPAIRIGWSLFDYEAEQVHTDTYGPLSVRELVISSNFRYAGYDKPYRA